MCVPVAGGRRLRVQRSTELTKQVDRTTAVNLLLFFSDRHHHQRGEVVVFVWCLDYEGVFLVLC